MNSSGAGKGVQRSLHPYNTVAAFGPWPARLLHDNLNDFKPLPHGIHSAYYRFCQRNGLVVGIGVRLGLCLTLIHTAEETRDARVAGPGFFGERRYIVKAEGQDKTMSCASTGPSMACSASACAKSCEICWEKVFLHEGTVGGAESTGRHPRSLRLLHGSQSRSSLIRTYWTWLVKESTMTVDQEQDLRFRITGQTAWSGPVHCRKRKTLRRQEIPHLSLGRLGGDLESGLLRAQCRLEALAGEDAPRLPSPAILHRRLSGARRRRARSPSPGTACIARQRAKPA